MKFDVLIKEKGIFKLSVPDVVSLRFYPESGDINITDRHGWIVKRNIQQINEINFISKCEGE